MTTPGSQEPLPDETLASLLDLTDADIPESTRETSRANLRLYLSELESLVPATPQEELALARQARTGNEAARARLVEASLRRVALVARRYMCQGLSLPDLIEEGNESLLHAVERYDPDRGVPFATHAVWWIRQGIVRALADRARLRAAAAQLDALRGRLAGEQERLRRALGREPTAEQLAEATGLTREEIDRLRSLGPGGAEPPLAPLEATLVARLLEERPDLASVLDDLSRNERDVLRLRLGVGEAAATVEATGDRLGMPLERVRQLEAAALRKVSALLRARDVEI